MLNRVDAIRQVIDNKSLDNNVILGILNLHKDKGNISDEQYAELIELVEPQEAEAIEE